ncbi:UNVERIFIED_CONTAM: hypothetical protein Sangu_1449700 [Sesamum angustifolium]|uniref:Uncharacterized protein n=1 Tax=Sesamum angustifolium TaxID=2727405 RepID=A0AAW2NA33_9LAMI
MFSFLTFTSAKRGVPTYVTGLRDGRAKGPVDPLACLEGVGRGSAWHLPFVSLVEAKLAGVESGFFINGCSIEEFASKNFPLLRALSCSSWLNMLAARRKEQVHQHITYAN